MAFSYATPGSGPNAGGIGWFNFGALTLVPGQTITGLTGTLNGGETVTFDVTNVSVSGDPTNLVSTVVPTWSFAEFGNPSLPLPTYATIAGQVAIVNTPVIGGGEQQLAISNIVVKDAGGNPIVHYDVVAADAESTNSIPGASSFETVKFVTNGGAWQQLAILGTPGSVAVSGVGTQTVTVTGTNLNNPVADYVFVSHAPSAVTLTERNAGGSIQGFAIGFAVTRLTLQKNIGARIDPTDQFVLNIAGSPGATATTAGAAGGIQTQTATVYGIAGNTYTFSEAMALGSASALGDYVQIVSAANATPGGTIPSVGSLPISFTPAMGDDVTYTVLNEAPPMASKTVDKAFADIGELLTYTVTVNNPNNVAINNVLVTDPTPTGTTYANSLSVSLPFTGTDPAGGITVTSIPANGSVTISYQVQVNTAPPVPNPVTNIATVEIPGFPTGNTNTVTTQVHTAVVLTSKAVDKPFAVPNDILTYTLTLNNLGNVSANNVVLTDAIPAGTAFVPGSVTGAVGTPPSLTLLAPIAAGGTATVTFQVQVSAAIPTPNPILNSAAATFTYTVDPANPNGVSGASASNTTATLVNAAIVSAAKAADLSFAAPGDIITYTVTLTNSGNTSADNVVLTDNIPAGTTFVPGSVTGATGTPPTLNVANIPAGGNAVVSFQVQVSNTAVPNPNPVPNSAAAAFTYTVDPALPDGAVGTVTSNTVNTLVNGAIVTTVKSVNKTYAEPGEILTYTLSLTNSGNAPANNVIITDAVPAGTTYVAGSVTGATGTPPTLILPNSIPAGGAATVTFQVLVGNIIPMPNPILNTATNEFVFTTDPAEPNGSTGSSTSNTVSTQINSAMVTAEKTANTAFSDVNGTVSYTITLKNTGNVAANNVVLTDVIPAGTTFVAGSLVGASGTPPTLMMANSIPAGGMAVVTFDVLIGSSLPNPNPIENVVAADFKYTVDPTQPNGVSGTAVGGPAVTQVNNAKLVLTKSADKPISYIGDIITYQISVKNTGNVFADNVVLTDLLPTGVSYVAGSLVVSVAYSGTLAFGLALSVSIPAGGIVTLSFKAKVDAMPNPNPILNKITAAYAYTVDPAAPDAANAAAVSNTVSTIVFRHNFSQQISDLIESVALEQAALAAIANAEGAKIQKMAAMSGVTTQELLCLNNSVTDMMDSIALLEAVLKQKLNIVNCQNSGTSGCM